MKKNRMMRAASALLVAVLLTTCTISGTFAKYVTQVTATDTARVARWSFNVNDTDITRNAFVFDLFNTVNDSDYTTDETDVHEVDGVTIIAPGTSGSFALKLENTSEVTAKFAIDFSASTTAIPVEYSLDKSAWSTSVDSLDNLDKDDTTIAMGGTETVTVYWRWSYDPTYPKWTDAKDTELGMAAQGAAQELTVTAVITATQVD